METQSNILADKIRGFILVTGLTKALLLYSHLLYKMWETLMHLREGARRGNSKKSRKHRLVNKLKSLESLITK